jgi:hypothetical protein
VNQHRAARFLDVAHVFHDKCLALGYYLYITQASHVKGLALTQRSWDEAMNPRRSARFRDEDRFAPGCPLSGVDRTRHVYIHGGDELHVDQRHGRTTSTDDNGGHGDDSRASTVIEGGAIVVPAAPDTAIRIVDTIQAGGMRIGPSAAGSVQEYITPLRGRTVN